LEDPNGGPNNVGIDPAYDDGVVTQDDIVQINNYYPFGLNMEGDWNGASGNNKYQYNGKEWNDDFGLGWNHHDWRFLDVALNRFVTVDPECETGDQQSWNPYHFGYDDPIRHNDPDGRWPIETIWDIANVVYDVGKLAYHGATGQKAAVATDLKDLGADVAATLTPYVPAGATKIARALNNTVKAVSAAGAAKQIIIRSDDENKKGNTSNGNKNSQHANQKAREAAEKRYGEAKKQFEEKDSQRNKTPQDKKDLEKLKKSMNNEKRKMDETGENHSRKHKGPQ
jgi:RHS repeat-associated protein